MSLEFVILVAVAIVRIYTVILILSFVILTLLGFVWNKQDSTDPAYDGLYKKWCNYCDDIFYLAPSFLQTILKILPVIPYVLVQSFLVLEITRLCATFFQ